MKSIHDKIYSVMQEQWLRPYDVIDRLCAIGEPIRSESSMTAELRRMRRRTDKWIVPRARKCGKGEVREYRVIAVNHDTAAAQ